MTDTLKKFLDFIIPRFMTDEVAFVYNGDEIEIVCTLLDVEEGEEFDGIVKIRCFNFFGFGLFGKILMDTIRPWGSQ